MKNKKIFVYIPVLIIIISCLLIAVIFVNNIYQKEKNAKKQESESQRKLLEKALEEQTKKIEQLEKSLNITKKEQTKFVNKVDLPKQALTTAQVVKNNEKYVVAVACNTKDGISLGSGVIVGKATSGNFVILTNYHVINGFYASEKNPSCIITPYHGVVHYAKPVYPSNIATIAEMRSGDWAFLEVTNLAVGTNDDTQYKPTLALDSLPQICNSQEIKTGSEIVILGYPSIGSNTVAGYSIRELIATEGIVSSSPSDWEDDFAVSAKIDHGSSGGGGFLKTNGCYAGIPSSAVPGEIESLGRLINIPNLNIKLSNFITKLQE